MIAPPRRELTPLEQLSSALFGLSIVAVVCGLLFEPLLGVALGLFIGALVLTALGRMLGRS